jgi:hypothetical protein
MLHTNLDALIAFFVLFPLLSRIKSGDYEDVADMTFYFTPVAEKMEPVAQGPH